MSTFYHRLSRLSRNTDGMALSMIPLSALAADGDVAINETNFPDANFRTYVQKTFDKDEYPFTDVSPAGYFYKPVLWAVENNITSGVSDTEFGPYEVCTRAQIATFLYKAFA